MEKSVSDYLNFLGVPISKQFIKKKISSHPDYPSVLSAADTMQQLGIPHIVAGFDKDNIGDLPIPVMIHIDKAGGSLFPVYSKQDIENGSDDLKYWSGIFIKAKPVKQIANEEHKKALSDEKNKKNLLAVLLLCLLSLSGFSLFIGLSTIHLFLWVSSMAGLVIGYFLLAKDLGITYNIVESVCNAGTGTGCGKVLQSKEGKLFGFISFTDLAFGYFAAQFFIINLIVSPGTANTFLTVLGWIGMLAIPMIAYSLWLQAVVLKEWCRLCLVVSGILTLQALYFGYLFFIGLLNPLELSLASIVVTLFIFGLAGCSLLLIKQTILQKNQAIQSEITANRIKNSPEVFTNLLFRQTQVETLLFEHDFLLGNYDAPVKFTVAVNLYCGPCKKELDYAQELLHVYPGMVNVSLRFLKSNDEGKTSNRLLQIWHHQLKTESKNVSAGTKIINAWYDSMDIKRFSALFPSNGEVLGTELEEIINDHDNWIKKAEITKTPTTYMNGYLLPDAYGMEDLFALIPGLSDMFLQMREQKKYNDSKIKNV